MSGVLIHGNINYGCLVTAAFGQTRHNTFYCGHFLVSFFCYCSGINSLYRIVRARHFMVVTVAYIFRHYNATSCGLSIYFKFQVSILPVNCEIQDIKMQLPHSFAIMNTIFVFCLLNSDSCFFCIGFPLITNYYNIADVSEVSCYFVFQQHCSERFVFHVLCTLRLILLM
jgi:hypothetical protein